MHTQIHARARSIPTRTLVHTHARTRTQGNPASASASSSAQQAAAAAAAAAAPSATMQRADAAAAANGGDSGGSGSSGALAPLGTVVPLHEVTSAVAAAEVLGASDACKEVVALLGLLEAVNRVSGARACACVEEVGCASCAPRRARRACMLRGVRARIMCGTQRKEGVHPLCASHRVCRVCVSCVVSGYSSACAVHTLLGAAW